MFHVREGQSVNCFFFSFCQNWIKKKRAFYSNFTVCSWLVKGFIKTLLLVSASECLLRSSTILSWSFVKKKKKWKCDLRIISAPGRMNSIFFTHQLVYLHLQIIGGQSRQFPPPRKTPKRVCLLSYLLSPLSILAIEVKRMTILHLITDAVWSEHYLWPWLALG